jgi:histidinol-phosphate aminotransferase
VLSPTGLAEIAAACGESGTIFIFDATYGDFSPNTATPADAFAFSNVLVSGSFSKSRGLAGFRIGYVAGGPQMEGILGRLAEAGPPFSLSSSAIEAGRRALSIDPDRVKAFVDEIRREVRELSALLKSMDFLVSGARQISCSSGRRSDTARRGAASKRDIRKNLAGQTRYEDLVRITVPGEAGEFGELTEAIISVGKIMGINKEALA